MLPPRALRSEVPVIPTAKIHIVSTGKPASKVRPIRELRHSSSCLECLGSTEGRKMCNYSSAETADRKLSLKNGYEVTRKVASDDAGLVV